jgi:hypothetical protein
VSFLLFFETTPALPFSFFRYDIYPFARYHGQKKLKIKKINKLHRFLMPLEQGFPKRCAPWPKNSPFFAKFRGIVYSLE